MFIEFYSERDDDISEVYLVAVTARLIMLENAYAGFALIKLLGKTEKYISFRFPLIMVIRK